MPPVRAETRLPLASIMLYNPAPPRNFLGPPAQAHCLEGAAATEFAGAPSVTWRDTEPPLKLRLNIAYTLSFSGDQAARAFAARDGLIAAAAKALAAACASYTSPISAGAPLRPKAE